MPKFQNFLGCVSTCWYSSSSPSSSTNNTDATTNEKYQQLFEDIAFCTSDSLRLITDRLDDFADPSFLRWLKSTQAKCEDVEEFQAIKDLRDMIDDAVKVKEDSDVMIISSLL